MEKVIITLRAADADERWCTRLRDQVAAELLEMGVPGLAVNVRDDAVRESLMTLTTLDPPVVGFVTLWTQQSYGDQVRSAIARLEKECDDVAAYLVTESVPLPPPNDGAGRAHARVWRTSRCFAGPTISTRRHGVSAGTSTTRRWPSKRSRHSGTRRMQVVRPLTPGSAGHRRDRRGALPDRGDIRSARVLRRRRRRRSARPDGAHGGQHRRLRRESRCRHGADESLCVSNAVRLQRRKGIR